MKKENQIPENFDEHLKEYAPVLFSINKENSFKVPEDYFDSLPDTIASKCFSARTESSFFSKFSFVLSPKIFIPLTVSISIILFIIIKSPEMNSEREQQLSFNNLASGEYQYLDSLIDNGEMDEVLLMDAAMGIDDTSKNMKYNTDLENNIQEMNSSAVVLGDSLSNEGITDDDIIQYLIDNDDNDEIINY